jgi:preprotein translocase subunit SecD
MSKAKKFFTSFRVLLFLFIVLIAIVAINPNPWVKGVAIKQVNSNSSAYDAGFSTPDGNTQPRSLERIIEINGKSINTVDEYYAATLELQANDAYVIKTNKKTYQGVMNPIFEDVFVRNITKNITKEVFNNVTNSTMNVTSQVSVPEYDKKIIGVKDIGLTVITAPTTNLRKGLDLSGGTRVLLKPVEKDASMDDINLVSDSLRERLNVYGLTDMVVRVTKDWEGNPFIIVEIAGQTDDSIRELISSQGNFEAKIGDNIAFTGGDDIKNVYRSPDRAGIRACNQDIASGMHYCEFQFGILISQEAANRQAEITKGMNVVPANGKSYLEEPLSLYLDGSFVQSLQISEDLKGQAVTDIAISGSGTGATKQEAMLVAVDEMKQLQTVLITGALPIEIEIVKTDTISPVLGDEFLVNTFIIGLVAMLSVAMVIFVRYRKITIIAPVLITLLSELLILLGMASLIKWNMDLISIAGIIVAIGTGVDDQIIIIDETLSKSVKQAKSWKDKIKDAFFIIFAAYVTLVVAMAPLWFAGAGLMKGFALTTIMGVTIGVLITRPMFAKIIEIFFSKN